MRILIMGLPGSGKTTLALELLKLLPNALHLSADELRRQCNDWDFSTEGRIRQAERMARLASQATTEHVIADFVCPTPALRMIFDADFVIWVDTITHGRYNDTNSVFVPPKSYNLRVTTQDAPIWARQIAAHLKD